MPVHNSDIIEALNAMAAVLEIEGANQFRVRAYRSAARVVGSLPQSVAEMIERNEDLSELSGIGKDLAEKTVSVR